MSIWNIYHKDGSILTDVNDEQVTVHGLEYQDAWMGECSVTVNIKNNSPIDFSIGDYIIYRGERFELNYDPGKHKQARKDSYGEAFVYDSVKFNSLQDELSRAEFLDVVLNDNELHYTALPKFSFYVQTIDDLLDRIQANLDEQIGVGKWKVFSRNKDRSVQRGCTNAEWNATYGEGTSDNVIETKSITIDTKKCWDALALVNSEWDINFVVRGRNIYVGTTGVVADHIFKYGLGEGLYQVDQNADSDQSVITRLRAYGSEKNLPPHYYADLGVKYFSNITKVSSADNEKYHYVDMLLDLDYIDTYFKVPHTYNSKGDINGFVVEVTFDFKTTITGYVSKSGEKCSFYSEPKTNNDDNGDEASVDSLDTFIGQVKSGERKLYIVSGLNGKNVPSSIKEYADNLPNNMAISRLMLPGFPRLSLKEFWDTLTDKEKAYVNPSGREHKFSEDKYRPYIDSLNIEQIGLRSDSKFFDNDDKTNGIVDIYPTIEEMELGGVRVDEIYTGSSVEDDGRFEDGQDVPNIDIFLDPTIDFDIIGLRNDDFTISMKDGRCGGRDFKVEACDKIDGKWRLTIGRVKDDALDLYFPYKDYQIKKGDHFVLTGIDLPDSYVRAASLKLLKYAIALLDKNDYTRYVYQPKVDEIFMARQHDTAMADKTNTIKSLHDTLKAGDLMEFEDDDLNIKGQITIDNLTIKEEDGKIPTYEVVLREDKEVGTIQKIQQQISSLQSGNGDGLTTTQVKGQVANEGKKYFLSRLTADTARGPITFEKVQKFLQGLQIGGNSNNQITADGLARLFAFMTSNFQEGLTGTGASIDHKGNAELNSLFVRQFISTPKFVFNEISVTKAEQWNTNGYGTIESVDTTNQQITLKLEENDYGSLLVGDICRGIYADIDNTHNSDERNEGEADECGFVSHRGFFTTYFYVVKIITNERGRFVFQYGKKSPSTPDPCAFMDFAQYGNFANEDRQSSMYFCSRGRSYIEVLDGVSTWEIQSENRVCRYGYLGGLRVKQKDGTYKSLKGNGIFAQNNIYFGGVVVQLSQISDLDDLKLMVEAYEVTLSQYSSVITVDDMGNVINGLWTADKDGNNKQYRISTAVFVNKGERLLLVEDNNSESCTEGHYRVYAIGNGCSVRVENGTVFLTGIDYVKDGVAGSADDASFDYDKMRSISSCSISIVVELEGKVTKSFDFPIRINHDSLPFMVCDLSNENASVAWNTKANKYIGFPIESKVSLLYHNIPYKIDSVTIGAVSGLSSTVTDDGSYKLITLKVSGTGDCLKNITKVPVTVAGSYAGARYEYTKEITISKSSDMVVYEVIPSADSVVADKDGNLTSSSVSCKVFATSSDDKRYEVTSLPNGYALKYSYNDNPSTSVGVGEAVSVSADKKMVTFSLSDEKGNILDKESVPVVAFGKDGKGVEYVFKRTTNGTAPSNPTPSGWEKNNEYLCTDKEFIPSGWTDNPTGVDAVNLYEWYCKRVSVNGRWGKFSDPAEHSHYGKHAAKATCSDDIITIPTTNDGYALGKFSEDITFALRVNGSEATVFSVIASGSVSNVSCSVSNNVAKISCADNANIGKTAGTLVFKVSGKFEDADYSDSVVVKVVPNVSGEDGDGYEYVYCATSSSTAPAKPSRANGKLSTGWNKDPMSPTEEMPYVWVSYHKGVVGEDTTGFSTPKIFSQFPRIIKSVNTFYGLSDEINEEPTSFSYDKMSDVVIGSNKDKYIWSADKITYNIGEANFTGKYCVGKCSELASITEQYGTSKSADSTPTTWADEYPASLPKGTYIWTRDKIVWKDGTESTSVAQLAGYIPDDGSNGKTSYIHVKYSNDGGVTFTSNGGNDVGDYIGVCTNFEKDAPTDVKSYVWSKTKGEQGIPGGKGDDGDGYEYVYCATSSSTAPAKPSRANGKLSTGWNKDPMSPTEEMPYVWVSYHKGVVGEDTTEFSTPKIFSQFPRSVKSVNTFYALHNSSTDAPANDKFTYDSLSNVVIETNASSYVWSGDKVEYTDKDSKIIGIYCVGKCSELTIVTEQYATSSSTNGSLSSWSDTYPTDLADGTYVWSRDKITWKNGSVTYSEAQLVGRIGKNGDPGKKGDDGDPSASAILTPNIISVPVDKNGNTLSGIDKEVTPKMMIGNEEAAVTYVNIVKTGFQTALSAIEKKVAVLIPKNKSFGVNPLENTYIVKAKKTVNGVDKEFSAYATLTLSPSIKGEIGVGVSDVCTYYAISAYDTCTSESYPDDIEEWSKSRVNPTMNKPYLWSFTKTIFTNGNVLASPYIVIGNYAEAGKMGKTGCIIRDTYPWKFGVTYHNDSALDADVKYIDILYVEDEGANDGWSVYQCNVTHKSSGLVFNQNARNSDGVLLWTKLSDVGAIYSPLIMAKNAKLKFAQSQQLIIQGESNSKIVMSEGIIEIFGNFARNIKFGVNNEGYAVLEYYDNNGNLLYDLGPNGLDQKSVSSSSMVERKFIKIEDLVGSSSYVKPWDTDGSYSVCYDKNVQGVLFGTTITGTTAPSCEGYKPVDKPQYSAKIVSLFQYTAAKLGNTYVADNGKGLSTSDLAKGANGKWFTRNDTLAANGSLTNLAKGIYVSVDAVVYMTPRQITNETCPKYRLQLNAFNLGNISKDWIYSLIEY